MSKILEHAPRGRSFRRAAKKFARDQRGASFIEYVIVAGLVAIAAIGAFTAFGDAIEGKIGEETDAVNGITP